MQLHLKQGREIISTVREGRRFRLPDGRFVSPAQEGWALDGYSLEAVPPPPPPPEPTPEELLADEREGMACSRYQLFAALSDAGNMAQREQAARNAGGRVALAIQHKDRFRRNDKATALLAQAWGLSDEQVDDLFRAAMQIEE
jgi:hypothetical protein